jgi:hypothetical protein
MAMETAYFMPARSERKREAIRSSNSLFKGKCPSDLTSFLKAPPLKISTY